MLPRLNLFDYADTVCRINHLLTDLELANLQGDLLALG
jgi:hypothetical protein